MSFSGAASPAARGGGGRTEQGAPSTVAAAAAAHSSVVSEDYTQEFGDSATGSPPEVSTSQQQQRVGSVLPPRETEVGPAAGAAAGAVGQVPPALIPPPQPQQRPSPVDDSAEVSVSSIDVSVEFQVDIPAEPIRMPQPQRGPSAPPHSSSSQRLSPIRQQQQQQQVDGTALADPVAVQVLSPAASETSVSSSVSSAGVPGHSPQRERAGRAGGPSQPKEFLHSPARPTSPPLSPSGEGPHAHFALTHSPGHPAAAGRRDQAGALASELAGLMAEEALDEMLRVAASAEGRSRLAADVDEDGDAAASLFHHPRPPPPPPPPEVRVDGDHAAALAGRILRGLRDANWRPGAGPGPTDPLPLSVFVLASVAAGGAAGGGADGDGGEGAHPQTGIDRMLFDCVAEHVDRLVVSGPARGSYRIGWNRACTIVPARVSRDALPSARE